MVPEPSLVTAEYGPGSPDTCDRRGARLGYIYSKYDLSGTNRPSESREFTEHGRSTVS